MSNGINFNFKGRESGRSRMAKGSSNMKSSRNKNEAGRSRSERKKGKGGNNGRSKKSVSKKNSVSKSVLNNCLKSWQKKKDEQKLSRSHFVKEDKPNVEGIVFCSVKNSKKSNLKRDSRCEYKQRQAERLRRCQEREQRHSEYLQRQQKKLERRKELNQKHPEYALDNEGNRRLMYCLFTTIRILLGIGQHSSDHYGMMSLMFPNWLQNLNQTVAFCLGTGYGERIKSLITSDTIVYVRMLEKDHYNNHISTNWFPGCFEMGLKELTENYGNWSFFSDADSFVDVSELIQTQSNNVISDITKVVFKKSFSFTKVDRHVGRHEWGQIETTTQVLAAREIYYDINEILINAEKVTHVPVVSNMITRGVDFESLMSLCSMIQFNNLSLFHKTEFDAICACIYEEYIEVAKLTNFEILGKVRKDFKIVSMLVVPESISLFRSDHSGFMPNMNKSRFLLARSKITNKEYNMAELSWCTPDSTVTKIWIQRVFKKIDTQKPFTLVFKIHSVRAEDNNEALENSAYEDDEQIGDLNINDDDSEDKHFENESVTQSQADRDNAEPDKDINQIFRLGSQGSMSTLEDNEETPNLQKILSGSNKSLKRMPSSKKLKSESSIASLNEERELSEKEYSVGSDFDGDYINEIAHADIEESSEKQASPQVEFNSGLPEINPETGRRPSLILISDQHEEQIDQSSIQITEENQALIEQKEVYAFNRVGSEFTLIEFIDSKRSEETILLENLTKTKFDAMIERAMAEENVMIGFCQLCLKYNNTNMTSQVFDLVHEDHKLIEVCQNCSVINNVSSDNYLITSNYLPRAYKVNPIAFADIAVHEVTKTKCECTNLMQLHHHENGGFCSMNQDDKKEMVFSFSEYFDFVQSFSKQKLEKLTNSGQLCDLCFELEKSQSVFISKNDLKHIYQRNICSECFFGFAFSSEEFELKIQMSDNLDSLTSYLWYQTEYNYCEKCRNKYQIEGGTRNVSGLCENCDFTKQTYLVDTEKNLNLIGLNINSKRTDSVTSYFCCLCDSIECYFMRLKPQFKKGSFTICLNCAFEKMIDMNMIDICHSSVQLFDKSVKIAKLRDYVPHQNTMFDKLLNLWECNVCSKLTKLCGFITKDQMSYLSAVCPECALILVLRQTKLYYKFIPSEIEAVGYADLVNLRLRAPKPERLSNGLYNREDLKKELGDLMATHAIETPMIESDFRSKYYSVWEFDLNPNHSEDDTENTEDSVKNHDVKNKSEESGGDLYVDTQQWKKVEDLLNQLESSSENFNDQAENYANLELSLQMELKYKTDKADLLKELELIKLTKLEKIKDLIESHSKTDNNEVEFDIVLTLDDLKRTMTHLKFNEEQKSYDSGDEFLTVSRCVQQLQDDLRKAGHNVTFESSNAKEINKKLKGLKFNLIAHFTYFGFNDKRNHISVNKFENSSSVKFSDLSDFVDIDSDFYAEDFQLVKDMEITEQPKVDLDIDSLEEYPDYMIEDWLDDNFKPNVVIMSDKISFQTDDLTWALEVNKISNKLLSIESDFSKSMAVSCLLLMKLLERNPVLGENWFLKAVNPIQYSMNSLMITSGAIRILYLFIFKVDTEGSSAIMQALTSFEDNENVFFSPDSDKDIFLDLAVENSVALEKVNESLKSLASSSMKTLQVIGHKAQLNEIYFDTNVLFFLIERFNNRPYSLPFKIILVQTVLNEMIDYFRSSVELHLKAANFFRSQEFEVLASNHGEKGDEHVFEDLRLNSISNESFFSLDKKACIKYQYNLLTESGLHHLVQFVKNLHFSPSFSWIRSMGSGKPEIENDQVVVPSLISPNNFLQIVPGNMVSKDRIPRLFQVKEPTATDSEDFGKYFRNEFKEKWIEVVDNKELFLKYHASTLEACSDLKNFKFVETRGRLNREFVSSIDPEQICEKSYLKTIHNFEESDKIRGGFNKHRSNKIVFGHRDSCLPHKLQRVKIDVDERQIFKDVFPTLNALKPDDSKDEVYNQKRIRTFKNPKSVIKMEEWESGREHLTAFDWKSDSAADLDSLVGQFDLNSKDISLVGESNLMNQIKETFKDRTMIHSELLQNYCYMMDHLIHDLVNISLPEKQIYISSNNFKNFGYIIGPGRRSRTVNSKKGVRYWFIVDRDQETIGFYPDKRIQLPSNLGDNSDLVISRFYSVSADDITWKSKLYVNLSLPRLKSEEKEFVTVFWSLFFSGTNVKKLLAFFKYFNIISLSTYCKLPGLINKYLSILPKREIEWILLNKVVDVVKSVILDNQPKTVLGHASSLNDYLELNNLYTLPKPQTTSATHDYQMLYDDIKNNINSKSEAVFESIFSDVWVEKKHISLPVLSYALKRFEASAPLTTEKEFWSEIGRNFESFFITNTNGVDPKTWKKRKNALIFAEVLEDFRDHHEFTDIKTTEFHSKFLEYSLSKLEKRKAWAFISIKPQKDAADREIVVQEFFTKSGHYAIQSVFRTLCEKWESELVTKSTHKKYEFISRLPFSSDTIFINDDMKKWSPHDIKEKFLVLIEMMDHLKIIPRSISGLLVRSYQATKDITLLFDERLRNPDLKWYKIEDLIGKSWQEFDDIPNVPLNSVMLKDKAVRLFHPLKMEFGWPQGILHFASSFYHGLASLYSEKVFLDLRVNIETVSTGFHSDDKNTAMKFSKLKRDKLFTVMAASDVSVRGASLSQSDTKSSVTIDKTIMKFDSVGSNKRASELVSVYNVEGTITDSYFRQASNLTNSFTFDNVLENHLSAITRACSIFSLSNRVFESEFIYSQLTEYLTRFYGKFDQNRTIMLGGLKSAPIHLIAEFGIQADNVIKLIKNPEETIKECSELVVIKSKKILSKEGERFKSQSQRKIESLRQGGLIDDYLASQLVRISNPISGVFLNVKDNNLNNLFSGKSNRVFSTWSEMKSKSMLDSDLNSNYDKDIKAEFKSIKEVARQVLSKGKSSNVVNEFLVQSESVYKKTLEMEFNLCQLITRDEDLINGAIRRAPVTNDIKLQNDFEKVKKVIMRGQNHSSDLDLMYNWNSIVQDIENFCANYNVRTKTELLNLNSVWDRMRRLASDRNPVMLLWKTTRSFTDCVYSDEKRDYDPATNSIRGTNYQLNPYSRLYIKSRMGSSQKIKDFSDRVHEAFNYLIFHYRTALKQGEIVKFDKSHQIVSDLWQNYEDLTNELSGTTIEVKSFLSLLSARYIDLPKGTFELVGTDDDRDLYIHQLIGEADFRIVESKNTVFAPLETPNELKVKIRTRFRGKEIVYTDEYDNDLNSMWAEFRIRPGFVKGISLCCSKSGYLKIKLDISTTRIKPDSILLPLHFRFTRLSEKINPKMFEKMTLIEKSSVSTRVHASSDEPPSKVPTTIWGEELYTMSLNDVNKYKKLLGQIWFDMNFRLCNYSKISESDYSHSDCHINSGELVLCTKTGKMNQFANARVKSKSKEFQSLLQSNFAQPGSLESKFEILNNFYHAISLMSGQPTGSITDFVNHHYNILPMNEFKWVTNFQSGHGLILSDPKKQFKLGFSFQVIKALLDGRDLASMIESNRLEEFIFPVTASEPNHIANTFTHAIHYSDEIKAFIESNPFLIEEGFVTIDDTAINTESESYKSFQKKQDDLLKSDVDFIVNLYETNQLFVTEETKKEINDLRKLQVREKKMSKKKQYSNQIRDIIINDYFSGDYHLSKILQSATIVESKLKPNCIILIVPKVEVLIFKKSQEDRWKSTTPFTIKRGVPLREKPKITSSLTSMEKLKSTFASEAVAAIFAKYAISQSLEKNVEKYDIIVREVMIATEVEEKSSDVQFQKLFNLSNSEAKKIYKFIRDSYKHDLPSYNYVWSPLLIGPNSKEKIVSESIPLEFKLGSHSLPEKIVSSGLKTLNFTWRPIAPLSSEQVKDVMLLRGDLTFEEKISLSKKFESLNSKNEEEIGVFDTSIRQNSLGKVLGTGFKTTTDVDAITMGGTLDVSVDLSNETKLTKLVSCYLALSFIYDKLNTEGKKLCNSLLIAMKNSPALFNNYQIKRAITSMRSEIQTEMSKLIEDKGGANIATFYLDNVIKETTGYPNWFRKFVLSPR
uniref:RNA-directed RNA polymerase L n=1 Tax=Rhizoctonia cerealis bunyavirus TaxID=3068840 RepID=A0AA51BSG6_9VIRU|nr:MAG: RNA-dependent RNA polymerase [Rhizoctonia cerealis bunyavirus]